MLCKVNPMNFKVFFHFLNLTELTFIYLFKVSHIIHGTEMTITALNLLIHVQFQLNEEIKC